MCHCYLHIDTVIYIHLQVYILHCRPIFTHIHINVFLLITHTSALLQLLFAHCSESFTMQASAYSFVVCMKLSVNFLYIVLPCAEQQKLCVRVFSIVHTHMCFCSSVCARFYVREKWSCNGNFIFLTLVRKARSTCCSRVLFYLYAFNWVSFRCVLASMSGTTVQRGRNVCELLACVKNENLPINGNLS